MRDAGCAQTSVVGGAVARPKVGSGVGGVAGGCAVCHTVHAPGGKGEHGRGQNGRVTSRLAGFLNSRHKHVVEEAR